VEVEMSEIHVIKPDQRDASTAQTPGMERAEGCGGRTTGASRLWVGHVHMNEGVRSGPHHHGETESAIYVISGSARFRYGPNLEETIEAQAGDFVFVPPFLVHQEINPSSEAPIDMIVARSSQENVVVNVELPQAVREG
jgi:uncharacterized RmlC-like cupin family protein